MADSNNDYKGAGKLTSALGKATLYSFAAMIPVGIARGVATMRNSTALYWAAGLASLATTVTGLVQGWNQADAAQKQHQDLINENVRVKTQNAGLQQEVTTAKTFASQFLDKHEPAQSHAERVDNEPKAATEAHR